MKVIIGVDPHKATHQAVAIDDREAEIDRIWCERPALRPTGCLRGRQRSTSGCGRSRAPAVSAICCLSSSSAPARRWWTCPPRWLPAPGCWRAVGRTRPIRTTPGRWRSRRCVTASCARSRRRRTPRCCGYWRSETPTSGTSDAGSCLGCTRCWPSSLPAGGVVATAQNYRNLFEQVYGTLPAYHDVPHAIPKRYESLFVPTGVNVHGVEFLRGVRRDVHQTQITPEWNRWHAANPNPSIDAILEKAVEMDRRYRSTYTNW